MAPQLTSGAIQRILNEEEVPKAVIQLLGYKKVPGSGTDRYRLLISDGVMVTPFAMLGTQLNHMIASKELEKFTVVQVDKCVCNNMSADKKVIILLSLSVLVPGAEVGSKLGNPVSASSSNDSQSSTNPGMNNHRETNTAPMSRDSSSFASKQLGVNQPSHMSSGYSSMQNSSLYSNKHNESHGDNVNIHPISSLTPYQNKWTIRARVTFKTPVKTWSNSRGEGKLFSVNLIDESGEIRATGFNESVDRFHDLLHVNKVYYISKATLKTANKNFSSLKNDYEMTFNGDTTVVPCDENTSAIPMLQFDFVPISQIESIDKDATVDVIGICKSASEVQTIVTRNTNREVTKREIRIVDSSNTEVNLTLWGDEAVKFDGSQNPVVAIKGARVSDFNGRSLSTIGSSMLQINPDIKEAHVLKGWYEREGCNSESQSISQRGGSGSAGLGGSWKTFAQVAAEKLGMGDKADYFTAKATVVLVRKENCMYMACPSQDCNKKVVDMNNGTYRCEKCGREYPEFKWRLLLSISLADFTENIWVTCFQEAAEMILGVKSQELGTLKETDEEKFNEIISEANFKSFIFKLRTKMETFNEESRLKTAVVSATPVEPSVYGKKLLNDIKLIQQAL